MKNKTTYLLYWTILFIVSISMFVYGIAKPMQFGGWENLTNLNEMSGHQLMWKFYGYSKAYPIIIGLFEITGAVALLFHRTRIFGYVLLSTILINIIIQDYIYQVSALYTAIYYQLLIGVLLVFDFDKIKKMLVQLFQPQKKMKNLYLVAMAFIIALVIKYLEAVII